VNLEQLQEKLRVMSDNGEDVTEVIREISLIKEEELYEIHQERVLNAEMENRSAFDAAMIEGFTIRELCSGEAQYQLLSLYFLTKLDEDSKKYLSQISSLEVENRSQEEVIQVLRGDITSWKIKHERQLQELITSREEIETLYQDIERLQAQIKELRSQSKSPEFTNLNSSNYAKQLAEQIRASQKPVLRVDMLDAKGSQIRVTHLDGTVTADSWLNKNKYRVVDEEEARSIQVAVSEPEVVEVVNEVEDQPMLATFQEPEGVSGVFEETVGDINEGSGEPIEALSLEERVARLEERVSLLEAIQ